MLIRTLAYPGRDCEVQAKFLKSLGMSDSYSRAPWPLPNMHRIAPAEFWGWRAAQSFKAEAWADSVEVEGEHGTLLLFFLDHSRFIGGGFAVVTIYRGTVADEAKYFSWSACDHSFEGRSTGNCQHEYTCTKCSAKYDVDSSG